MAFTAKENGKVATYYAPWAGRAGKVGPSSLPMWMVVCGDTATRNLEKARENSSSTVDVWIAFGTMMDECTPCQTTPISNGPRRHGTR